MRKFDVAFDVNISQRHKLRLGPFMRDGAHLKRLLHGQRRVTRQIGPVAPYRPEGL